MWQIWNWHGFCCCAVPFMMVMVMKRSEPRRQMWDGHCAAAASAAGPFMDVSAAKPPPSQCDALRDFNCLDNRPIINLDDRFKWWRNLWSSKLKCWTKQSLLATDLELVEQAPDWRPSLHSLACLEIATQSVHWDARVLLYKKSLNDRFSEKTCVIIICTILICAPKYVCYVQGCCHRSCLKLSEKRGPDTELATVKMKRTGYQRYKISNDISAPKCPGLDFGHLQ